MIVALLVVASICLLLAVHPFITYPLSLLLLRRSGRLRASTSRTIPYPMDRSLTFAVCMCAYNEEAVIEQKVLNLMRLRERNPSLQILIYVDASSDRTASILQAYESQIDLFISKARRGKTYGMNCLSDAARADVLLFTDANVLLDARCLEELRQHFADPHIGCVNGNLNYTNKDASVTAASGSLYWRFEEALKRLESDTQSMVGADGSIFAIRRELRCAPPDHIIDDFYVSLTVLLQGYRVIQANDVRAYEESVTSGGEEFNRKVRIACQAFNVHRLLWPSLRQLDGITIYKYLSHKLLRWLSIYFLLAAAIAASAALLLAGQLPVVVLIMVLTVLGILLGHIWSVKPFVQLLDLLVALTGVGLGVLRSIRGDRFQTWTPAASIRGRLRA